MKIEILLEKATHQKSLKQSLLTFIRVVSDGYNAHGSRNVFAKPHHVCSSVFVCSNNCMLDPISPEQQISVHCHVKRMLRSHFGQYLRINNFVKNQEDFFQKDCLLVSLEQLLHYVPSEAMFVFTQGMQFVTANGQLNNRFHTIQINLVF